MSSNGSRSRSFTSGFVNGFAKGPSTYFGSRHSTLSALLQPSQPPLGLARLVWNVGPVPTARFAREAYGGLLSPTEQQTVNHVAGHATGNLAGSLATGAMVEKGLNRLQNSVPARFKPLVGGLRLGNGALTGLTLWDTPQRFNRSLQQESPAVHEAARRSLSVLNQQQPGMLRIHLDSMTSLFQHSAQQRRATGSSSFRGARDLSKILPPIQAPSQKRR